MSRCTFFSVLHSSLACTRVRAATALVLRYCCVPRWLHMFISWSIFFLPRWNLGIDAMETQILKLRYWCYGNPGITTYGLVLLLLAWWDLMPPPNSRRSRVPIISKLILLHDCCTLVCCLQVRRLFFGDFMDTETEKPQLRCYDEVGARSMMLARCCVPHLTTYFFSLPQSLVIIAGATQVMNMEFAGFPSVCQIAFLELAVES